MKKIKSQKGIGGTDAIIAVVLITLFSGLIVTLSYNIYVANSSLKRMSIATGYITDIFEDVDKTYYDNVTEERIVENINEKNDKNIKAYGDGQDNSNGQEARYKITISVQTYKKEETEETLLDLVKTVTVKVTYKLQNKDQTIEMSKIKKRENLITPNRPDLKSIEKTNESNKIYPIRYVNNEWQVTNENDANWYNYSNGYWAVALETADSYGVGDTIDIMGKTTYIWVPKYAYNTYNNEDIKFLYSTSNKYVEKNENKLNILKDIESNYEIIEGKWTTNTESNINEDFFQKLTAKYPMKNMPQ